MNERTRLDMAGPETASKENDYISSVSKSNRALGTTFAIDTPMYGGSAR